MNMDQETLVKRNQQLAYAFHQPPMRHRLRRWLTQAVAYAPIAPLRTRLRRVLLIRPDHLGDMLLTTPAIRALKLAHPFMEIHVLAGSWAAGILANYAEVDQVLTLNFPGFNRHEEKQSVLDPYRLLLKTSRQLRRIGYSAAVIMRPDHWWGAMLAHVAGIRERIGYDLPEVAPFLTHPIPYHHEHVIRQNLRLVESWTGDITDDEVLFSFDVYEDDRASVQTYLAAAGIGTQERLLCIHAGAGTWVKLWDTLKWAKVADILSEQLEARVIFTGSDQERLLIETIMSHMTQRALSTAGDLRIEQLAALYQRAKLVLGPDSGPMHLAAAVHTPTVALFGPADPIEFGTWGNREKHAILTTPLGCRPCRVLDWGDDDAAFHPCVREISISQVLDAAHRVLQS